MPRKLFTVAAGVSAVLCAVFVVAWICTHDRRVEQNVVLQGRVWNFNCRSGRAWVTTADGWPEGTLRPGERVSFVSLARDTPSLRFSGHYNLAWESSGTCETGTADWRFHVHGQRVSFGFMLWFATALTALLPLLWAAVRIPPMVRRRKAARLGLCPSCGYDLRATPGRCPECGAPHSRNENPAGAAGGDERIVSEV